MRPFAIAEFIGPGWRVSVSGAIFYLAVIGEEIFVYDVFRY